MGKACFKRAVMWRQLSSCPIDWIAGVADRQGSGTRGTDLLCFEFVELAAGTVQRWRVGLQQDLVAAVVGKATYLC